MSDDIISIDDEITCINRELKMRAKVYPRWIESGKMEPAKAQREIDVMTAVLERLRDIRDTQP